MQEVLSVSDVNSYLKSLVDNDVVLNSVLVRGEISNFKQYSVGGTWYFTLKDQEAQINCVVFNNFAAKIKFIPQDGDSIIVKGKVAVFNKRGTYSIQVFWMEPEGLGALAKAFEQLKEKLSKEGLFAESHKKPLPLFPKKIAILAAAEGAAVRDIINVSKRRNRAVELYVLPTVVQGKDAVESIIANIQLANNYGGFDVVILARGGGSLEDLWSFNEEQVARAIFDSNIPIVSAVGHEVDFTIADFVADLRAATPSVAAELVVPDIGQYKQKILGLREILLRDLNRLIVDQYQTLDYYQETLKNYFVFNLERIHSKLQELTSRLKDLNPLAVLKRGYAVVEKEGLVISSIGQVKSGDIIKAKFIDGFIEAKTLNVKKGKNG